MEIRSEKLAVKGQIVSLSLMNLLLSIPPKTFLQYETWVTALPYRF